MHRKHLIAIAGFSLLAAAWSIPLGAVDIYQWVDENGVTHFSQWAPAESVPGVSQRTLVEEAPAVDPEEDRYAIEKTAQDMEALWDELELKRERRRAQAAASKPAPLGVQAYQEVVEYPYWPSVHPPRPGRPDWRPEPPIEPDLPGGRPPLRPNPPVAPPASVPFRKPAG